MKIKKFITGRNCKVFTDLDEAKKYADKWRDKSISVYQDGRYFKTIHKCNNEWVDSSWDKLIEQSVEERTKRMEELMWSKTIKN